MNIINLPIVTSTDENEVKTIFTETYIGKEWHFEGVKVVIFEKDFEHVCFEYDEGAEYKKKFSLRRARKLFAIQELCDGKIPYILIHQADRPNRSICVLAESIELAMYLVPQPSPKGLFFRLGTIIVFGKDVEKKIEKQKRVGRIIGRVQEVLEEVD